MANVVLNPGPDKCLVGWQRFVIAGCNGQSPGRGATGHRADYEHRNVVPAEGYTPGRGKTVLWRHAWKAHLSTLHHQRPEQQACWRQVLGPVPREEASEVPGQEGQGRGGWHPWPGIQPVRYGLLLPDMCITINGIRRPSRTAKAGDPGRRVLLAHFPWEEVFPGGAQALYLDIHRPRPVQGDSYGWYRHRTCYVQGGRSATRVHLH